jgi:arylsulfatase A-like enzyme
VPRLFLTIYLFSFLFRYTEFVTNQIRGHDPAVPLFVYAAFQGVHYPLQVPRKYWQRYTEQGAEAGDCMWDNQSTTPAGHQNGFSCEPDQNHPGLSHVGLACECNRLLVKAQVSSLSEAVGNITSALQESGLWNNTVLM